MEDYGFAYCTIYNSNITFEIRCFMLVLMRRLAEVGMGLDVGLMRCHNERTTAEQRPHYSVKSLYVITYGFLPRLLFMQGLDSRRLF